MRLNILLIGLLLIGLPGFLIGQTSNWSMRTPELGGTLRVGVISGEKSLWFSDFSKIKEKKTNEELVITLKDELIGKGEIDFIIRPLKDSDGAVMKLETKNIPEGIRFIWTYGGASNEIMEDNVKPIRPKDCHKNVFSIEGNSFTLYYGTSRKLKILEALTPPGDELRLADAKKQNTPFELLNSGKKTDAQVVASAFDIQKDSAYYFCFYYLNPKADYNYFMLPKLFENGSYQVNKETEWMKSTPD